MSHMTDTQITEIAASIKDGTKKAIVLLAERKTESKSGPAMIAYALLNDLGPEKINSLPIPGTETGNNVDKYKVEEVRDGKTVKVNHSVITQLYDATVGAKWAAQKADYALATSGQPSIRSEASDELKKKLDDPEMLLAEQATIKSHWSNGKATFSDAIRLLQKMRDINELSGVTCKFYTSKIKNKAGEFVETLVKSPNCVKVVDKEDPSKARVYSVPQIKGVKLAMAEQLGGTLDAFEKATARGTKSGGGGDSGTKTVVAKNATDFYNALLTVESFLIDYETADLNKKHLMAIRNEIGKNKQNMRDWLLLVGRVSLALDPIFTEHEDYIRKLLAQEREEIKSETDGSNDKTQEAA